MTAFAWIFLAVLWCTAGPTSAQRPNVLLLAIDDLNDWVGCMGGHPQARTPNIDRLARRGVLFTNAHCQAPICNPSRTSVMLGLRPSTTGIYVNAPWFRRTAANAKRVTLGQYFGARGYRTLAAGKIYHGSRVDEASFQTYGPRPGQRWLQAPRLVRDQPSKSKLWDWGGQSYADERFSDHIVATWAVEQLRARPADDRRPLFLAAGFYRPHVPLYAPQRYIAARPLAEVVLPKVLGDDRDDLPAAAIRLTHNPLPPAHQWFESSGQWRHAVRAYLASVTFMDEQIGRVLDALDAGPYAKDTIVVLFSDHGFFLGEKQRWAKQSLWERATRVPLIVSVPEGPRGKVCSRPVELLSLYPTLVGLCGLPAREDLDGVSLQPLLKDPGQDWQRPAVTTYQRDNHAVRSEHFRYIRYADGSEELYDHRADPDEWKNLAAGPAAAATIATLRKWLPATNVPDARR